MFPLEVEVVISLVWTSKFAPNWGDVSSATFCNTVANANCDEPFVCKNWPPEPSPVGQSNPSSIILPDPLGVIGILPLLADIIPLLFTSKSPPSWGEVSLTISARPPDWVAGSNLAFEEL